MVETYTFLTNEDRGELEGLISEVSSSIGSNINLSNYYTKTQVDQIIADVTESIIESIGVPVLGTVDSDNNIILSGSLTPGNYTIKYEFADGSSVEIGQIKVGA